jgi:hypothetical protein
MDNNRVPNADHSAHSYSINHNTRNLHSPQKTPIMSSLAREKEEFLNFCLELAEKLKNTII